MHEYKLIRARRKTVAIYVTKDARVEVRAPHATPRAAIDAFVSSRAEWIDEHVEKRRLVLERQARFSPDYGSCVRLLGACAQIAASDTLRGFANGCVFVPPAQSGDGILREVRRAYVEYAREVLPAKAALVAQQMGVSPASVRVTDAKTQWGSCSARGRICFSWRLVMADERCVDYVVAHELAHILHHDHSPRFWAAVDEHVPDRRECVERLRELHRQLMGESW